MNMRRTNFEPLKPDAADRSIHIDGSITGRIAGAHVVLGSHADVDGDIVAAAVTIHGRFRGQIDAGAVYLRQTCNVEGTIRHQSLIVEMGAHFDGTCQPRPDPAVPVIGAFVEAQA